MNEIKSLWQFLDTKNSSRMSLHTKIAIKLIILTGVRTAELRLARWGDFDIEKSVWTIPAENTKTRLIHKVHLGI
jgi:integrase